MKHLQISIIFLLPFFIGANGNNGNGLEYRAGIRVLSLQSLNDALQHEGLAVLNPIAFSFGIGKTIFNEKIVFNYGFHGFAAHGSENLNRSHFLGYALSLDFGYQIWRNDKMCLYPYINASYYGNRFQTFQKTDANSFGSVYAQPLVERTFNRVELDAALGLSYQIKINKQYLLRVGGGYHFRLWQQNDWRHRAGNKIDFPKVDNRGWEIGISWVMFRKRAKKEE